MRTILLMRHGQAESMSPTGADSDRALTREGQQQATAAAGAMSALGLHFDAAWYSPYPRAKQAFERVNATVKIGSSRSVDTITPNGNPEDVAQQLFDTRERSLLVVSHLPLLPAVYSILLGDVNINLAKAGLIKLIVYGGDRPQRSCVLDAHVPVALMSALAR